MCSCVSVIYVIFAIRKEATQTPNHRCYGEPETRVSRPAPLRNRDCAIPAGGLVDYVHIIVYVHDSAEKGSICPVTALAPRILLPLPLLPSRRQPCMVSTLLVLEAQHEKRAQSRRVQKTTWRGLLKAAESASPALPRDLSIDFRRLPSPRTPIESRLPRYIRRLLFMIPRTTYRASVDINRTTYRFGNHATVLYYETVVSGSLCKLGRAGGLELYIKHKPYLTWHPISLDREWFMVQWLWDVRLG